MAHSSAPDRHHEPDSTHRPGTRLPATVSAVRDADRGTRLGVGTGVLTAVVAAPLRIVRQLGQSSRTAAHLVARGAVWIARAGAAVGRPLGTVLSWVVRRFALAIVWCARSLRTVLERCLSVAEGPIGVLRRGIDVVIHRLGRVVRGVARVGREVTRRVAAFGRLLRQAVQPVLELIARRLRALGATLAQTMGALLRQFADFLAPSGSRRPR